MADPYGSLVNSFNISAATAVLKEMYDGQVVNNEVYKKNPFYAMVKKNTDFFGKTKPIPIQIGVTQGRSSNFQTAQTNQSAPVFQEFFLSRAKDYSLATIQNEVLLAAANDGGAFVKGAKVPIDSAIRAITLSLASALFRNGLGSIGQIGQVVTFTGSTTSTVSTFTLSANSSPVVNGVFVSNLAVGDVITSANFPAATTITSIASGTGGVGTVYNTSAAATATSGSTTITTGRFVLSDVNAIVQFELNMTLQSAATDGGVPRGGSTTPNLGYVVSLDRINGVLNVSNVAQGGAISFPLLWAANDYLAVQGDSPNGGSGYIVPVGPGSTLTLNSGLQKLAGLAAWLPANAPSATDNFFGVNRSIDPVRLAGVRYNGSGQSIEEALIDSSSIIAREGGLPDKCVMGYASYSALEKSLGSKLQYVQIQGPAEIAFQGILINGAAGPIEVFPDRNCPSFTAYMLQMDTWSLEGLGEMPRILEYLDGFEYLRVTDDDSAECRVGYYGNLACNAPGWNGYVQLGA